MSSPTVLTGDLLEALAQAFAEHLAGRPFKISQQGAFAHKGAADYIDRKTTPRPGDEARAVGAKRIKAEEPRTPPPLQVAGSSFWQSQHDKYYRFSALFEPSAVK